MTKMRKPDPGEGLLSRYVVRPVVWFVFQFGSEARFIRKHRRQQQRQHVSKQWP
jgi:hypothetical protein